jgi:HEAT repeat protein
MLMRDDMESRMNGGSNRKDVLDADAYSVEELRRAVLDGVEPPSRPLALALLGRKDYPQKSTDMKRLLLDEKEVPRYRSMAAQILGQMGTSEAVRALRQAITIDDDVALRGVIAGLQTAGSEDARAALSTLGRRRGTVGRAARRSRAVLEHRQGERGVELDVPAERSMLRVSSRTATAIDIASMRGKQLDEAVEAARQAVPALAFASEGAVSLRCGGNTFVLVLEEQLAQGRAEAAASAKAQVGVVVRRRDLERKGWELAYHVLTRPRADGKIDLFVTSGVGRVVLAGTARPRQTRVEFRLQAVASPGAVAVDLAGVYEAGKLTFSRARSSVRRRQSSTPKARRGQTD